MFEWLRIRKKSDAVDAEPDGVAAEALNDAWGCEPEVTNYRIDFFGMDDLGGLNGMSQREEEEFFSTYGPTRKMRKEMPRRVKARQDKS